MGEEGNEKGIPNFWLTVFQNANSALLEGSLQQIDEPIFKHLTDITVNLAEKNTSFVLNFYFSPNEFFTNSVLTKEYSLKSEIDPEDPLSFDGPEMLRSKGCKIDWKSGKNTTVKIIKQKVKQKGKGKGAAKVVTKRRRGKVSLTFLNHLKFLKILKKKLMLKRRQDSDDFDIGFNIKEK